MKKFKINFEGNLLLDLLIAVFLSHIYYKITFIETIEKEFSLISQIRASNVTSTSFLVESPTNTIIALIFGINDIDIFKIVVYIIKQLKSVFENQIKKSFLCLEGLLEKGVKKELKGLP